METLIRSRMTAVYTLIRKNSWETSFEINTGKPKDATLTSIHVNTDAPREKQQRPSAMFNFIIYAW